MLFCHKSVFVLVASSCVLLLGASAHADEILSRSVRCSLAEYEDGKPNKPERPDVLNLLTANSGPMRELSRSFRDVSLVENQEIKIVIAGKKIESSFSLVMTDAERGSVVMDVVVKDTGTAATSFISKTRGHLLVDDYSLFSYYSVAAVSAKSGLIGQIVCSFGTR